MTALVEFNTACRNCRPLHDTAYLAMVCSLTCLWVSCWVARKLKPLHSSKPPAACFAPGTKGATPQRAPAAKHHSADSPAVSHNGRSSDSTEQGPIWHAQPKAVMIAAFSTEAPALSPDSYVAAPQEKHAAPAAMTNSDLQRIITGPPAIDGQVHSLQLARFTISDLQHASVQVHCAALVELCHHM